MNEADARHEAEEHLKAVTAKLQEMKDDKETFEGSLELAGIDLEDAEVALERGDSEASQREVMQALERMHAVIRDALELASAFTTPKSEATLEAMLDKVNNLRVDCWNWGKRLQREYEVNRETMGNPACPVIISEGIARVASEMGSERATDYCLHKCPYADRCDPSPKR